MAVSPLQGKIEFLLLPEHGEQSVKKMNKSPCSSRCGPGLAAPGPAAAGTSPSKVLLFILRPLGIISWRPCTRVRPRRHATQRARSEIFKLSLSRPGPSPPGTVTVTPAVSISYVLRRIPPLSGHCNGRTRPSAWPRPWGPDRRRRRGPRGPRQARDPGRGPPGCCSFRFRTVSATCWQRYGYRYGSTIHPRRNGS